MTYSQADITVPYAVAKKVLLPRVLPYQPLLLGYDHPEGQLQNGLAKLDDQECMQKHT